MSASSSCYGSPVTSPSPVFTGYATNTTVQMVPETELLVQPEVNMETAPPAMVEPVESESHGAESEVPKDEDEDDDEESIIFILESEDSQSAFDEEPTFPEPTLRGRKWFEGEVAGDTVEGWGFLPWFVDDDGALAYPHPLSYHDPFHRYHNGYYGSLSAEDHSMPRWPDIIVPSCLAPNGPTLPSIHDLLAAPRTSKLQACSFRLPSDPTVFQQIQDARDEFYARRQREALRPVVDSSSPVASSPAGASSSSAGASFSSAGASYSSTSASSASFGTEPDWLTAAKDVVTASFERQQRSSSKRKLEVEPEREVGDHRGSGSENSRRDCSRSQDSNDGVADGLEMEFEIPRRLLKWLRHS